MTTAAGARLTEAHRLAQLRVGAQTVKLLGSAWRLLDPENLDRTVPPWLEVAVPLVQSQAKTSANLAANYLRAFRAVELGAFDGFLPTTVMPDVGAITTSLTVTGPISLKVATGRGGLAANLIDTALARSSAAGMRHALAGGRDTVAQTVAADPRAIGWSRVTSGKACDFCSMLADRGAIYSEDTVDFMAHDGCGCSAEPAYE